MATVVLTVLVLFSPWGIEFGNLNPLEDVLFGVRFGDLRGWIGAAGIAIVLFAVGVVTTRLFVTWLDRQLLSRTTLNSGLQHSITTMAGYLGFLVAMAIALNQAGVQLQNIALVASALSVGIGFGLQQVVSNFVAGLIVLAERPIRVGDVISVRGEEGKVRKISVRATEIALGENTIVIVPNSDIVSSAVKNRSFHRVSQRASVKLVVTRDADLKDLFRILLKAANDHDNVLSEPVPSVLVGRVSESGIEVDLQFVVDRINKVEPSRSDIFCAVLPELRSAGITLAGSALVAPQAPAQVAPTTGAGA